MHTNFNDEIEQHKGSSFLIDTLFFIFMVIIAVGIVTAVYDLFIGIDVEVIVK